MKTAKKVSRVLQQMIVTENNAAVANLENNPLAAFYNYMQVNMYLAQLERLEVL